MFDFSLAELGVVGVVALAILGPKELYWLAKGIKRFTSAAKLECEEIFGALKEAVEEEEIVTVVFDDKGNPQKTYDLKKIKPLIHSKDKQWPKH